MKLIRFLPVCIISSAFLSMNTYGQESDSTYTLTNNEIESVISINGIESLVNLSDPFKADIIGDRTWGRTRCMYRVAQGDWLSVNPYAKRIEAEGDTVVRIIDCQSGMPVCMEQKISLKKNGLDLDISIETKMQFPVTIGDLAISFPWRTARGEEPSYIFEQCFTKHHFIAGDGSFLYFTKPSGEGPFVMVLAKPGTKLEYFNNSGGDYMAYIHSAMTGNRSPGNWRQEHTTVELDEYSGENSKLEYGFKIRWAENWDDMRELLYQEGLFDIRVVPGMTIPSDLKARFALHTKNRIDSIVAEYPRETNIKLLEKKENNQYIYEVDFKMLGENMLTVFYNGKQKTYLEFFSTEPLETLIKKRSAFIVNSQQHRDTTKWYNGLFSVYDMKNGVLRGPDNTDGFDGWWGYVLTCDDPGLCKAPYVAAKNVYYPDDKEIEAVEYYLENFVWGGLQRTDKDEPYPYGIWGVPNWKVVQDPVARAGIRNRHLDKIQVWRAYDYPHIFMLYYHMYQIAKMYPEKVNYLDAAGYLERAWQTARVFFIYPYEILPDYDIYKWGYYNELVVENLIDALEEEGRPVEAEWLRQEYEKKVRYFVYDDKYPYRSEFAFDRTAFESSYALAKYGTRNEIKPVTNSWFDKNMGMWRSYNEVNRTDARDFMNRQHYAGLAVRGWLEAKYYLLGSDFTNSSDHHCLSYMAIMGGRSILDYGINFAEKPYDWLQLGYASYLSSWALMNTGTLESDYGYWAPGKKSDGAIGWAFMSAKRGRAWIRKEIDRGAWFYDGEIDLGKGAAIRTAISVLTNDPLFGWIAYGAILEQNPKEFNLIPKDGLRSRFALVTEDISLSVQIERDGFLKNEAIIINKNLDNIDFIIENRSGKLHNTRLTIENRTEQKLKLELDGEEIQLTKLNDGRIIARLKIENNIHKLKIKL